MSTDKTAPSQSEVKEALPKAYDPSVIEQRWADYWVNERLFDVATPEAGTEEQWPEVHTAPPAALMSPDACTSATC